MRDVNEIKKARAIQVKKEKRQLLIIITMFILIACVISMSFLSNAKGMNEYESDAHYESIVIKDGDSLWSIVHEYNLAEDCTTQQAIAELMYLNGMQNTTIFEGQYLVICCENY